VRAVDCLGFAGGFTLGMVQAGFELVGKREMRGGFGVANCEANRHLLGHSWQSQAVDPAQWDAVDDVAVVFGNPPCSGFSGMSAKHFRGAHSPINHCMWAFVDYVARVRPTIAVFESVQLAFTRPDGLELMRALRAHLEAKTNDQWTLYHVLHNAYSIGACSQRRRYFWVVSRVPFGIEWPSQDGPLPVLDDVIGDLEGLPTQWAEQPLHSYPSHWARPRTRPDAHVDGHVAVRNPLTQRVVDLLAKVDWRPGEHLAVVAKRYHHENGRLPDSWQATEHKVIANNFNLGYNTPVRWRASDPARVVTGAALFTALHPRLPRMLTHREVARVMGFPDTWLIEPLKTQPGLPATWGKGITVDCGRWIGEWIQRGLAGSPGTFTGPLIGDREYLIDVTDAWKTSLVQSDSTLKKFKKLLSGERGIMTDPNVAPEVPQVEGEPQAAATEATDAAKSGKGRPRPQNTIELDERGYAAIEAAGDAGHTKESLATALGVEPSKAYLVLYRLRVTGRVHKVRQDGNFKWKAGPSPATPASTPEQEPAAPAEVPVAI
jgi:site-specific DNA-cytosine methylase